MNGRAMGNVGNGVTISFGATGNTIGGTAAGAGNVISGNTSDGVNISGAGTNLNVIAGDHIGVDKLGDTALRNCGNGVTISGGAAQNVVGGADPGVGNVISGNTGD